jgi:hypothetical protein
MMELFPARQSTSAPVSPTTWWRNRCRRGQLADILVTVESGLYGGIPEGGVDFGIAHNTYALIEHPVQKDFYNGAGISLHLHGGGRN